MIIYPRKISPSRYISEVFQYKDLLYLLSKKWIKTKYEHSYIGLGWIILSPLITTIVYTIFFGMAFNIGINGINYFIFIYSGMLPWLFFRDVFIDTLDIFPKESQLIKYLNFPRIIVPMSLVFLKVIEFLFGVLFLFIIALCSGRMISINILVLPILILQIIFISIGSGLLALFPCIIYRDIRHLLKFIVPLGIYTLPIIYKMGSVSPEWLRLYTINPMVSVIQAFRTILFREDIPWYLLMKGMSISLIVFITGVLVFMKYERRMADYF